MFNWFRKSPPGCEHDWEEMERPMSFDDVVSRERHRRRMLHAKPGTAIPAPCPEPRDDWYSPRYLRNRVCIHCGLVDNSLELAREEAAKIVDYEEWRKQQAKEIWESREKGPSV